MAVITSSGQEAQLRPAAFGSPNRRGMQNVQAFFGSNTSAARAGLLPAICCKLRFPSGAWSARTKLKHDHDDDKKRGHGKCMAAVAN